METIFLNCWNTKKSMTKAYSIHRGYALEDFNYLERTECFGIKILFHSHKSITLSRKLILFLSGWVCCHERVYRRCGYIQRLEQKSSLWPDSEERGKWVQTREVEEEVMKKVRCRSGSKKVQPTWKIQKKTEK